MRFPIIRSRPRPESCVAAFYGSVRVRSPLEGTSVSDCRSVLLTIVPQNLEVKFNPVNQQIFSSTQLKSGLGLKLAAKFHKAFSGHTRHIDATRVTNLDCLHFQVARLRLTNRFGNPVGQLQCIKNQSL